jgi:hypothetical protein
MSFFAAYKAAVCVNSGLAWAKLGMGFARLIRPRLAHANLGHPYGVVVSKLLLLRFVLACGDGF